jgi:hypothetical protein
LTGLEIDHRPVGLAQPDHRAVVSVLRTG